MKITETILWIVGGVIILSLLWLICVAPITGVYYGYSTGERTGDIYKFSQKGMFWKSWEGEMYLGGVSTNANGNLQMERFNFSIPSRQEKEKADLIKKIKECAINRKTMECTIQYKQWLIAPIYQDTEYTVVGVKQIKK